MRDLLKDKIILVTGGTGTIGSKLVIELLKYGPKQIRIFSRDESKQHELIEKIGHPANLRLLIGDIRDKDRLDLAFRDVDIVFHAAALKHVPFCEYNPFEAVKTNIIGSQNVIDAALANQVEKVVAISTDKTVNPSGVMGVSKLMMEKLFINANYYKGSAETIFSCVRFGNVAWARGSVLNSWQKQAAKTGMIKVTDEKMTRFMMSQEEAINLVFEAAQSMKGGEMFVFKMPAIKITELAKIFINKYFNGKNIGVQIVGKRAGEKIHEELLGLNYEQSPIFENEKMFIIRPRLQIHGWETYAEIQYPEFTERKTQESYSSADHLNAEKIKDII